MFTTGMAFSLGEDIDALRDSVRRFAQYEIGAGTSEIRRMLIGREMFAETA